MATAVANNSINSPLIPTMTRAAASCPGWTWKASASGSASSKPLASSPANGVIPSALIARRTAHRHFSGPFRDHRAKADCHAVGTDQGEQDCSHDEQRGLQAFGRESFVDGAIQWCGRGHGPGGELRLQEGLRLGDGFRCCVVP